MQSNSFVQQYFRNSGQSGNLFPNPQASVVQLQEFPQAGLKIRIDDAFLPCQGNWNRDESWDEHSFGSASLKPSKSSPSGLEITDRLEFIGTSQSPMQTHLFSPMPPQLEQIVRHHTQRAASLSPHAVTVVSPSILTNAMTRVQTAPVEQTQSPSLSGLYLGRHGRASRFGTQRRPSAVMSPEFQFRDREIPRARVRSIY